MNNYAYALGQMWCFSQATVIIEQALLLAPENETVQDTCAQIRAGLCALFQGYYFGRTLPISETYALLVNKGNK